MADFKKAISIILKHEGGYVNDPKDPGGETKYGISKRAFPSVDIKALTVTQAEKLYKVNYWDLIKGDFIEDQNLAENIFDFAVNSGVSRAVKLIQKVANAAVYGTMGELTIYNINSKYGSTNLNFLYAKERILFYVSIVEKNSDLSKFLKGWKNRALSFLTAKERIECLALLGMQ